MIWAHASTPDDCRSLVQLFVRVHRVRPEVGFVLTVSPDIPTYGLSAPGCVAIENVPDDTREAVTRFLDHWRPDVCVWTFGKLHPTLINAGKERGIAFVLVNAMAAGFAVRGFSWLPDPSRKALAAFDVAFVCNISTRVRLMRLGMDKEIISVVGRLQEAGAALACDDTTLEDVVSALDGRQVWLAAHVQPDELLTISEAHRGALSFAHRLLLVIVPDDDADEASIASSLDAEGWRLARWSLGELPTETTQILIADTSDELGMWYRVAPITFVGSSLASRLGGRNPFEAMALGSAVLHGPFTGQFSKIYKRLGADGAARLVRDASSLRAAVVDLTAPDKAAQMAHAAWEVVSEGADATDRLVYLLEDILDALEEQ